MTGDAGQRRELGGDSKGELWEDIRGRIARSLAKR
jgi:hypothetical protein